MDKIAVKLRDTSTTWQDMSQHIAVVGKEYQLVIKTPNVELAIRRGALVTDSDETKKLLKAEKEAEAVKIEEAAKDTEKDPKTKSKDKTTDPV